MVMSLLELRHVIESGLLPLTCRCTCDVNGDLTIELLDESSGTNLVIGGIPIASLQTSRDIANLIAQLRSEIARSTPGTKRSRA
ncbi:DUF1652 domain-containing protein [Pseudomonas sp. NFR16]|uniref:DUF1652 domain-containing protein n=1 Tax=Pseudomonas sp. NFR16 TaxID=1566248 RepID=UPI0008C7DD95|nr:DUF1652 domain-containing protein [Pseudomonas sp. NFR16]SEI43598.1 Protein of unknown function [Pseudomonas sp. NFR16]